RACVGGSVRQTAGLYGRRRNDSLHGHAGREISRDAVRHHRRAGAALECARAERVPAHSDWQARDHGHRPHYRGSLFPAELDHPMDKTAMTEQSIFRLLVRSVGFLLVVAGIFEGISTVIGRIFTREWEYLSSDVIYYK